MFGKIVLVILFFTVIVWFLTSQSESMQYQNTDSIYDYQNLILHELVVRDWAENLTDSHLLKKIITENLNSLEQMAYVLIFNDTNKNRSIEFFEDEIIDTLNFMNLDVPFAFENYTSYMDAPTLSKNYLELSEHEIWVSYGDFFVENGYRGSSNLPAVFVELPIENNKILAVWFITDFDMSWDIYWPAIIVPIAILLLLSVLFWIIRSFLYPIKLIRRHVINLKKGNLGSKIPIAANDELGQLSRSINKMTKDIDILVSQKQNLLIDVSHELKTPLTRLKFLLANTNINKQDKDSINKEINFLQDMISNMLLSDKLSTPYIEDLELENIEIKSLIDDACGMFYEIDKRLKILGTVPSLIISVDKYKLSLAIKNLIDNAIKYGGDKRLIELSVSKEVDKLFIQVEDFGEGMDSTKIKKITKPLYRGRLAKEKSKGGFGLGLAIAKKIVEAHNGELIIKSELSKGTKFIVSIPLNK